MLKIQRRVEGMRIVLALSGRIDAESLTELEAVIKAQGKAVVLDLKEVNLVSQEAVQFLVRCENAGASLENCQAYVREWIARERQGQ